MLAAMILVMSAPASPPPPPTPPKLPPFLIVLPDAPRETAKRRPTYRPVH